MILLDKTHLYTQSIVHSSIIALKDDGDIRGILDRVLGLKSDPVIHRQNHAQAYSVITQNQCIIAINGTDGSAADWVNNIKCWTSEYFHDGISGEYDRDLKTFVTKSINVAKLVHLPVKIFCHSQGYGPGLLGNLYAKETERSTDIETVASCGLKFLTKQGVQRMKAARCRVTHIINPGDIVPKIGGIIRVKKFPFLSWAMHYGYTVRLPKVGNAGPLEHSWRNVMDGLKALYKKWGLKNESDYIEEFYDIPKKIMFEGV